MPMPSLQDIPHVTPIPCPACASGQARLVRRGPDAFKRDGKSELWTYRCESCGREFVMDVEN